MIKLILGEAWLSITTSKLRTFLTTLGIVIGVCAVVIMVAAGQTVNNTINNSFAILGGNMFVVVSGGGEHGGIRQQRARPTISRDDIEAIKLLDHVVSAAPLIGSNAQVVYGSNNWNANIQGSTPDILFVHNWEIEQGASFSDRDVKSASPYVLIGETVRKELFSFDNPVGRTIRIKNLPFRVIGLLKARGQDFAGNDQDNVIIMPATTMRQRIDGSRFPNLVHVGFVKVDSEDNMAATERKINFLLRSRHHLKDKAENDFNVRNMTELLKTIQMVGMALSLLLASIASISLIVGSIGIMNMMLVSVTERTREIGIRKALGAPNKWIMFQFLAESVIISLLGSILGLIFGIIISQIAGVILGYDVPISIWAVVLSFSVAVIVGIASGILPAIKAMKLDPIEALRYQ